MAEGLELCCFCSEAGPGARHVLFNAQRSSCRKQGTAEPGKLVVAPPGQFHSVEAHLQAPRLSLT